MWYDQTVAMYNAYERQAVNDRKIPRGKKLFAQLIDLAS
jgi:hypothetical protein